MSIRSEPSGGAYGLALPDLAAARELLVDAGDWPAWRIVSRAASPAELRDRTEILRDDRARLRVSGGGFVELDRESRRSVLHLPARPVATEIVHPFLGLTAAMAARWRGWCTFHAGSIVAGGGAWGVLGSKGDGKSTLLAWFATQAESFDVLADDVLVVDEDGRALCGPRCLDLRLSAAERFGPCEPLGLVGARERWRLRLGGAPHSASLRGWLCLGWGERARIRRLSPAEAFVAIASQLAIRVMPPNPERLLELAGLPAWRLIRPRSLEAMDSVAPVLARAFEADPVDALA